MKQQLNFFIMPAFFTHTPTHSSTVRASINAQKLVDYKKPIGVIGDSIDKAYGFNGDTLGASEQIGEVFVVLCLLVSYS